MGEVRIRWGRQTQPDQTVRGSVIDLRGDRRRRDDSHLFAVDSGRKRKWIQIRYPPLQTDKVNETGKIRYPKWNVEIQIADRAERVIEIVLLLCHWRRGRVRLNSKDEGNSLLDGLGVTIKGLLYDNCGRIIKTMEQRKIIIILFQRLSVDQR